MARETSNQAPAAAEQTEAAVQTEVEATPDAVLPSVSKLEESQRAGNLDAASSAGADMTSEAEELGRKVAGMTSELADLRRELAELGDTMEAEKARTESARNEASELRTAIEFTRQDGEAAVARARATTAEIQERLDSSLQVCVYASSYDTMGGAL